MGIFICAGMLGAELRDVATLGVDQPYQARNTPMLSPA
jgi:hypothetical protein